MEKAAHHHEKAIEAMEKSKMHDGKMMKGKKMKMKKHSKKM